MQGVGQRDRATANGILFSAALAHEWFVCHGESIRRYVLKIVKHNDVAEDLLQETFLRALTGQRPVGDAQITERWLFAIARNAAIDHLRRRRVADELTPALLTDYEFEESMDDTTDWRVQESMQRFCGLPLGQQRTLWLRYFMGLSTAEIACVLGCSSDAVRHSEQRALVSLRRALAAV
jgi:RNA polymerase sigma-70 factor (ECF subfamily)